jgi:probable HAF family extracellular repeat protein
MARYLLRKRLMWGMIIAIGIVIAIVVSTLGDSLLAVTAATKPSYIVKDLGTLGGDCYTDVLDINNVGQAVGSSCTSKMVRHAVSWYKGQITDLTPDAPLTSFGTDINNTGKMVGLSYTNSIDYQAMLWDKGKTTNLGTLGGKSSEALAINNAGQVVGVSQTSSGDFHAV